MKKKMQVENRNIYSLKDAMAIVATNEYYYSKSNSINCGFSNFSKIII